VKSEKHDKDKKTGFFLHFTDQKTNTPKFRIFAHLLPLEKVKILTDYLVVAWFSYSNIIGNFDVGMMSLKVCIQIKILIDFPDNLDKFIRVISEGSKFNIETNL
jgi:hypothetical protein